MLSSGRLSLAATLVVTLAAPAAAQLDGAFTLRQSDDGRLQLNFTYQDGRSNWGRSFERSALSDVSQQGEKVTFAMRRAAGSFTFEGRGTINRAAGWYVFTPNGEFRREMEKLGFSGLEDKHLFVFALDDLNAAGVRQLQGLLADRIDTEGLVRLINHGAGLRYVQEMTDAGFRKLTSDEYRRARDHGVSAQYAKEMMQQFGLKPSLPELVRLRDHGVSLSFIQGMKAAGFEAGLEDLVRARDHGVTPEFVSRMKALGYGDLELSEYVRMRDHGVTPQYVEELRAAGLDKLSARELTRLRDHGISASYVKRMRELFKEPPSAEQIIRLRTRGDLPR
jgi:hypothetical protein